MPGYVSVTAEALQAALCLCGLKPWATAQPSHIEWAEGILKRVAACGSDDSTHAVAPGQALCIEEERLAAVLRELSASQLAGLAAPLLRAMSFTSSRQSMVICCGGTSGSGKSTFVTALASRLGYLTTISTDTVRNALRAVPPSWLSASERSLLSSSSYDAAGDDDDGAVPAFGAQCALVHRSLLPVVSAAMARGESITIEGVHVTPAFFDALRSRCGPPSGDAPVAVGFLLHIVDADTHRERFASRAKSVTLLPKHNKYVQHFGAIRRIQQHLVRECHQVELTGCGGEMAMCALENSNVDQSIAIAMRQIATSAGIHSLARTAKATDAAASLGFESSWQANWNKCHQREEGTQESHGRSGALTLQLLQQRRMRKNANGWQSPSKTTPEPTSS